MRSGQSVGRSCGDPNPREWGSSFFLFYFLAEGAYKSDPAMEKGQSDRSCQAQTVLMDEIEHIKENIIPLDTGWDLLALYNSLKQGPKNSGLDEDEPESLVPTKEALKNSEDPLEVYYVYLKHLRHRSPSGHPDFVLWLEKAVRAFRKDPRYKNDRRYLWMWMSVASRTAEPASVFKYLSVNEIGTELPAYYEQYAKYLETVGRFNEAKGVLVLGINRNIAPERLKRRLEELGCRTRDLRDDSTESNTARSNELSRTSPLAKVSAPPRAQDMQLEVYNDSPRKLQGSRRLLPTARSTSSWGEFGSIRQKQKENISSSQKWDNYALAQKVSLVDQSSTSEIVVYQDDSPPGEQSGNSLMDKYTLEKTRVLREKHTAKEFTPRNDSLCRLPASRVKKDKPHRVVVLNAKLSYSNYTTIDGKRVQHELSFEELRAKRFLSTQREIKEVRGHTTYDQDTATINTRKALTEVRKMFSCPLDLRKFDQPNTGGSKPRIMGKDSSSALIRSKDQSYYHSENMQNTLGSLNDSTSSSKMCTGTSLYFEATELASPAKNANESSGELSAYARNAYESSGELSAFAKDAGESLGELSTFAKNVAGGPGELSAFAKDASESSGELSSSSAHWRYSTEVVGSPSAQKYTKGRESPAPQKYTTHSGLFQSEVTLDPLSDQACASPHVLIDVLGSEMLRVTSIIPKTLPGIFTRAGVHFDIKNFKYLKPPNKVNSSPRTPACFDGMSVLKEIGEGANGKVYLVEVASDSEVLGFNAHLRGQSRKANVALKVAPGQNPWEYVALSRLHSRLPLEHSERIIKPLSCFIFKGSTCMFMDYIKHDTLLECANRSHNYSDSLVSGFDESLIAYWSIEIIRTVEAAHTAGIIHRDIKADNFLLRLNLGNDTEDAGARGNTHTGAIPLDPVFRVDGSGGWKYNGLVLIDWGSSIDLEMFDPAAKFYERCESSAAGGLRPANAEDPAIECWEVRSGMPYRYECDWYGVAGIIYVLMFGRYMKVHESRDAEDPLGRPTLEVVGCTFKRYWQTGLWKRLFHVLLNSGKLNSALVGRSASGKTGDCGGDRLLEKFPLVGEIRALRQQLEEWICRSSNRDGRSVYGFLKRLCSVGRHHRRA